MTILRISTGYQWVSGKDQAFNSQLRKKEVEEEEEEEKGKGYDQERKK